MKREVVCDDCATLYGMFPLDMTIPNDQWAMLHDDAPGGILCADCMVRRAAARIPGVVAFRGAFETDEPLKIIPQDEYDRLRRAMWRLMRQNGWPFSVSAGYEACALLLDAGFINKKDPPHWRWTDAARAFAAEMEGE